MKPIVILSILAVTLASCESVPSAPLPPPGASEVRIEDARYRVTFRETASGPVSAEDMALLRAADLTLAQGYEWFRVVSRSSQMVGGNGPVVSVGTGGGNFGRRSAVGVSVGTSFRVGGGPQRTAVLEIILNRGETPRDRDAYNAADVAKTIRQRL